MFQETPLFQRLIKEPRLGLFRGRREAGTMHSKDPAMTMPARQRATSFLDDFGSPDRVFLERRPAWKKVLSVLAVMLGGGFLLLGLLFLLVMLFPAGGRPPLEAAERVVGCCLSAIFLGLAVFLFYAPVRRWRTGVNGCACYSDKFVTFNRLRWRCVSHRDLLRVENRRTGVTVTTADGATLRISGALEDRETLYRLLQQAIPEPVETVQTTTKSTDVPVSVQTSTESTDVLVSVQAGSGATSSSRKRAASSQVAGSNRSGPNTSFNYHDPLRRYHLALYGGVLIVGAIFMHGAFAELASGERESVRLWIGFAFLYDLLGPTLAVWGSGLAGVTLVAVGIIRGSTAPKKEAYAGQYDPLSSRTF